MGIHVVSESGGGGAYRWLKSARGTRHPESGSVDVSSGFGPGDVIKSGTMLVAGSGGVLEAAGSGDDVDDVVGAVWHDVTVTGNVTETVAVLTDVTVVAEYLPDGNPVGLEDGRYIFNAEYPVSDTGSDTGSD